MSGETRAALKAATHDAHEALDRSIRLGNGPPAPGDLCRHLDALYGFMAPLEDRLRGVDGLAGVVPDLEARWRSPWLWVDLTRLGVAPHRVPRCADLPEIQGLPDALGCLYVLEGSTLGGRVIARRLAAAGVSVGGRPARSFEAHGDQTGARWGRFVPALDGWPADDLIPSAVETFRALERWMRQRGAAGPVVGSGVSRG